MIEIIFATTNDVKIAAAAAACEPFNIKLKPQALDITEIQAADGEPIARDKAEKAFAQLQKPVLVTDDSWLIPGLHGFPGAYMKDISAWLTAEDWLNLTRPLSDRRVFLQSFLAYHDDRGQNLFKTTFVGKLLTEARGSYKVPAMELISFDGGNLSVAEHIARDGHFNLTRPGAWQDFARWYLRERSHEPAEA